MKNAIPFLTLVFILVAGMVSAQPGRGRNQQLSPEQQAEQMTLRMTKHYSLTAEQQAQVKTINLDFVQKRQALRGTASPEAMEALRNEHQAALETVFTDEQEKLMGEFRQGPHRHSSFRPGKGVNREDRQAMRAEQLAYRQENILPVMAAQRAKLEPKITAADQALISSLRAKLEECKEACLQEGKSCYEKERPAKGNKRNKRAEMKGQRTDNPSNYGFKPERMGIRMLLRDESARRQAEQLVTAYEPEMEALFAEIASNRGKWQEDMQAIRIKYCPACGPEKTKGQGGDRFGKRKGAGPDDFNRKLHFLLLLPELPETGIGQSAVGRDIKLFPNPAGAHQQIEFDVLAGGNVLIVIVDRQGIVRKTVFSGDMVAGTHRLEVNTADLPRGQLYFYRITDGKGTVSKSFMVRE